ncbi:MAG: DUF4199 domain-containing protein [Saprospiraceae bacterium]|nr:DUF4199 domain-containing protein [Saprospiraceae bacterium]
MTLLFKTFKIASIGGVCYILGRFFIHKAGLDYTTASDWLFRVLMVVVVSFSILRFKASKLGYLSFRDGFSIGGFTTIFLAFYIAFGTWFFVNYINPLYTQGVEKSYRKMQYKSMMEQYVYKNWNKKDTITQGAIDTVQHGLDMYIEKTKFYFTLKGQVFINGIYSLIWGVVISLTVSLMTRKVKEE